MDRVSRETWSSHVQRWQRSGLTTRQFAEQAGLNPHTLAWWKWRLSTPGVKRSATSVVGTRPAAVGPLTFVEIPVSGEPVEVLLPSGLRVRVPHGFDAEALERLLDVLERRR